MDEAVLPVAPTVAFVELSESVPSALKQVRIVLEMVELVQNPVDYYLQEMVDRQPELPAHLEQKSAAPAPRFQADLPLDFDILQERLQEAFIGDSGGSGGVLAGSEPVGWAGSGSAGQGLVLANLFRRLARLEYFGRP